MQTVSPRPAASNGAERMLGEAVRRLLRHPRGCVALVLRLSGLPPPAPRPHHRRIARALMQDAAQRHDGQVWALACGDLALLCRLGPEADPRTALDDLPATLARLLHVDMPDPARLISLWPLESEAASLQRYLARLRQAPEPATPLRTAKPPLLMDGPSRDWLQHRLSAVVGDTAAWRPLHRVVAVPSQATTARLRSQFGMAGRDSATTEIDDADPFLLRHVAAQCDLEVLDALRAALGGGGPLDAARPGAPALQVTLTLPGIASEGCAAWIEACRQRGAAPAVAVELCEAGADAAGFAAACARVQGAGLALLLSGVPHLMLLLARPWALGADLMLLEWSRHLAELAPDDARAVAAGIAGQGAARTLLAGADTEAALRWGLAHGIRRFQGRTVDAMGSVGLLKDASPEPAGAA